MMQPAISAWKRSLRICSQVLLLGLVVIGVALCPREYLFPLGILFGGILLGMLLISILASRDFSYLFSVFLGAFMARVFLSIVLYVGCLSSNAKAITVRNGFFIGDGYSYSYNGAWIARERERGREPNRENIQDISMSKTVGQFDYWNAAVYALSGESPFSMFFLNALAGSSAVIFIYLIALLLWNRNAARGAAFLCGFWPSHILWGSQNLKEPFTILFVCLFFWAFLHLLANFRFHLLGICILSLVGAFLIRAPLGAILFLSFFLSLLFSSPKAQGFVILLILSVFLFSQALGFGMSKGSWSFVKHASYNVLSSSIEETNISKVVENISDLRKVRTEKARTAFLSKVDFKSGWGLLLFLPLGLFYVFFAPFPWQASGPIQLFGALESLIWYFLFLSAARGFIVLLKKRTVGLNSLAIFILFMAIAFGLIEGNAGTLFRHRCPLWVLLFVFVAVGFDIKKKIHNIKKQTLNR